MNPNDIDPIGLDELQLEDVDTELYGAAFAASTASSAGCAGTLGSCASTLSTVSSASR